MYKRIAVVGVGNTIMGDEGFGERVIEELKKRVCSERVTLINAGTSFFNLVSELTEYDKIIIVDVVKGGCAPGTIYRFKMSDIDQKKGLLISMHDIGVIEAIKLERLVGKLPEDIVFYGIEPSKIALSLELSDVVEKKLNLLVDKIKDELNKEAL